MLNTHFYTQEYQPESPKLSNLSNSSAPDHIHRDARYLSLGFGEFYHLPKQKIAKSNLITQSESSHLLLVEVEIQNYPLCLTRVATWTCSGFVSLPLWGKNRHQIVCQAVAATPAGWQMVSSSVTNLCLHYRLLIKPCLAWRPWWSGLTQVRSSIFQVTLSHARTTQGHFLLGNVP